jgi:hypothetical protein
MMQNTEIEEFARKNVLTPHEVERDYLHSWLLSAVYSRPSLMLRRAQVCTGRSSAIAA